MALHQQDPEWRQSWIRGLKHCEIHSFIHSYWIAFRGQARLWEFSLALILLYSFWYQSHARLTDPLSVSLHLLKHLWVRPVCDVSTKNNPSHDLIHAWNHRTNTFRRGEQKGPFSWTINQEPVACMCIQLDYSCSEWATDILTEPRSFK